MRMEARGFESLTSAVQRWIPNVAVVRWCLEIPANKHVLSRRLSYVSAVVRLGWCQFSIRFAAHSIWRSAHTAYSNRRMTANPFKYSLRMRITVHFHPGGYVILYPSP